MGYGLPLLQQSWKLAGGFGHADHFPFGEAPPAHFHHGWTQDADCQPHLLGGYLPSPNVPFMPQERKSSLGDLRLDLSRPRSMLVGWVQCKFRSVPFAEKAARCLPRNLGLFNLVTSTNWVHEGGSNCQRAWDRGYAFRVASSSGQSAGSGFGWTTFTTDRRTL